MNKPVVILATTRTDLENIKSGIALLRLEMVRLSRLEAVAEIDILAKQVDSCLARIASQMESNVIKIQMFRPDDVPPAHPVRVFWEQPGGPCETAFAIYDDASCGDLAALTFYSAWRMVTADIDNAAKLNVAVLAYEIYRNA